MNILKIYPSFKCTTKNKFYPFTNRENDEVLSVEKLKQFLDKNYDRFSKFIVTGGEPMELNKDYFDNLIDLLKQYGKQIIVNTYPVDLKNYRNDVDYDFSYEFLGKPRAIDAWNNMMNFKQPFSVNITLTPAILRYHPNKIFQKLSFLKNIKSIEFNTYYKNTTNSWNYGVSQLDKYIKAILGSKIELPFTLKNRENFEAIVNGESLEEVFGNTYCILPDGELYIHQFGKDDIRNFEKISDDDIGVKVINYPIEYTMYNNTLQNFYRSIKFQQSIRR